MPTKVQESISRLEADGWRLVRRKRSQVAVIEQGPVSFDAYVPNLPGCAAAGKTREEVSILIQEAIEFHIDGLKADGQPIPAPRSSSELVSIDALYLLSEGF